MKRFLPYDNLSRGFVSGIVIALLSAVALVAGVHGTSALGGNSSNVWRDVDDSVNSTTPGTTAGSTNQPGRGGGSNDPDDDEDDTVNSPAPDSNRRYVALGDSVAAGLGLPLVDNAATQDTRCGRSSQAYPYEVGRRTGRETSLFACSGASSGDLFTRQWISNSNPNIQLQQAFADGQPSVISITVGANDIGWNRQLQNCYAGTCGTTTQSVLVNTRLLLLQRNLFNALGQIKERSDRNGSQPPLVVLTGYYNPVSAACTTALPDRITASEVDWLSGGVDALNQTLEDMAGTYGSFVRFAPVDFSGHDICSTDSWVQGLTDQAPIHPTAEGQQVIADSVIQAIEQFDYQPAGDDQSSAI